VRPPGDREHSWRQVHPGDRQAQFVQVRGYPAGAAPDVGHRSAPGGAHQVGESGEQRPIQRFGGHFAAESFGVVSGHGVVGGPGAAQEVRFGHGRAQ